MKRFFVYYLVCAVFFVFTACDQTGGRRNGAVYNPDGIELIYVEGVNNADTSIESFYIGKLEITQAQWEKIMGSNPSDFKGANLPVENVSWHDVQAFITRLNSETGKKYRLPTNVEWEFAAHGGTATKACPEGCDYSGGNNLDDIAWYKNNSNERTQPVGTKKPNELGIYDMTGNVWEWCENEFIFTPRPTNADTPPPPPVERRAVRGGSWGSEVPRRLQIAFNTGDAPDYKSHYIGFRVLLVL